VANSATLRMLFNRRVSGIAVLGGTTVPLGYRRGHSQYYRGTAIT